MKFTLSIKFNRFNVAKKEVEAKDRPDLDKVIDRMPFWKANKDRTKVELVIK